MGEREAAPGRAGESPAGNGRPVLAVTVGDPCGIGPEIVLKALADERVAGVARLLVLGDEAHLRKVARDLKLKWPFGAVVSEPPSGRRWERPQLLDLANVPEGLLPGQVSAAAGRAAGEAIERAVALAMERTVDGIVTGPIHKEALSLGGYGDPGHTEMLARLSGAKQVGMMFWAPSLAVGLLTTHLALREAIRKVRRARVARMLRLFDREWRRFFGEAPRIAVAGLNPHAGERGRFGVEELEELVPAIEEAAGKGVAATGPWPADTVFQRALAGEFDLVLALYHDQGTIPVKLVCGHEAVNVTVGLPFVRTSVDHGTAMDIAGKGVASPESLVAAIRAAARLVAPSTA